MTGWVGRTLDEEPDGPEPFTPFSPLASATCSCLAYAFASTSRTSTLSSVTVSGRIASGP